jgi:hypothetical protein
MDWFKPRKTRLTTAVGNGMVCGGLNTITALKKFKAPLIQEK